MSTQTLTRSKQQTNAQEQIFNLLTVCNWNKVKQEVKTLYTAIKQLLPEDEQNELLINIYLETLILDDYSTYWNYMNS